MGPLRAGDLEESRTGIFNSACSLDPFFGSTPLLLLSYSCPTKNQCSSFLPFENVLKTELGLFQSV